MHLLTGQWRTAGLVLNLGPAMAIFGGWLVRSQGNTDSER